MSEFVIRPATSADIDGLIAVHAAAFHDKFLAAFGIRQLGTGLLLMAETWRRQGSAGLNGMWVVVDGATIVATIALRARITMRQLPAVPVEWLFIKKLGFLRALYALTILSVIDHPVGYDELYISDVAVHPTYQRRGIARIMLTHALDEAQRLNLRSLCLYVSANNHAACALYQSAGYQPTYTHRSLLAWVATRRWRWLLMVRSAQPSPRVGEQPHANNV